MLKVLVRGTARAVSHTIPYVRVPKSDQQPQAGVVVNDVHSRLNEARVNRIVTPTSIEEVQSIVRQARAERRAVSIAGGRHAMGGQQFGADTILLDTSRSTGCSALTAEKG